MIGIIGGSGFGREAAGCKRLDTVETPWGEAYLGWCNWGGIKVAFLPRHGPAQDVAPHLMNFRANIAALRQAGVRQVLATAACGALRPDLPIGALLILDQFIDMTRGRAQTFQRPGEKVLHADVTEPYCGRLRKFLLAAGDRVGVPVVPQATYVCAEGPRFETAAEIRAFRVWGADLVGMTGVPEVVLAREAGVCYAALAVVTNFAAGVRKSRPSHREVLEQMAVSAKVVRKVLQETVRELPDRVARCVCGAQRAK